MGASNARAAHLLWHQLSDGALRLLTGMALTSLDNQEGDRAPRLYFGGIDDLIGYVRSVDSSGRLRSPDARKRSVYRYLAELRAAGAVKITRPASNGSRAIYALNLSILPSDEFGSLEDHAIDRRPRQETNA